MECLSVIGRTSRLPCCPRSHIAAPVRHGREAHPETPTELQPQEGPLIAGLEVLFASREYAPPLARFPARKSATIKLTHYRRGNARVWKMRPEIFPLLNGGKGRTKIRAARGDDTSAKRARCTLRRPPSLKYALCSLAPVSEGERKSTVQHHCSRVLALLFWRRIAVRLLPCRYIDYRFSDLVGSLGRLGGSHSASLAGQAMNRYRGTQAEFQFSIVSPHTAHSKLLISRASAMCSLRS